MTKTIDLHNLTPEQREMVSAMALSALTTIANYEDPEVLRKGEESEDMEERSYGLDADEVIEMAYDNVLSTARSAMDSINMQVTDFMRGKPRKA